MVADAGRPRLRGALRRPGRPRRGPRGDRARRRAPAAAGAARSSSSTRSTASTRPSRTRCCRRSRTGPSSLIGATTENPYFEVNSALISRTRIYELRGADGRATSRTLLRRALDRGECGDVQVDDDVLGVPRRPLGRRRAHGAERARAGAARPRPAATARSTHGGRRGRAAAQGGALRPRRRQALRLHLGLDQVHARLGPRRVALLPRGDARGRRGPALHRPAHGHPRLRGRRQRRPAGAAGRGRRGARRSSTSGCPRRTTRSPRRRSTWRWRRSPTPRAGRCTPPAPTCASTARRTRRRPLRSAAYPARRKGSAAASATTTRTATRARQRPGAPPRGRSRTARFYAPGRRRGRDARAPRHGASARPRREPRPPD